MPYTLVGAPALGFDLVRAPSGPNVAQVLLTALRADARLMQQLANRHPGSCRRHCWDAVVTSSLQLPRMRAALSKAPSELDLAEAGQGAQELITRLTHAPLGDLEALEHLVRRDMLAWTWERSGGVSVQRLRDRLGADVLCDAAASAYCAPVLADDLRRHLATPYLSVLRSMADGDPYRDEPLEAVLREVSTWTEQDRADWRAAVDLLRSGTSAWAESMHEAGWAAHLSGRTRTAAAVQLRAVLAFRAAGFTETDAAQGSWNALSGALHALLVSDLLGDDHVAVLLRPWELARGSRPAIG
jgi:hypothetical protein